MSKDSGSSTVTQTQEFKPPQYTQQAWQDVLNSGLQLTSIPQDQWGGLRVAPMNDVSNAGLQMAVDRAVNGSPDLNAARGANMFTVNGGWLGASPGANANVKPGLNPLMGSNPYLNNMISANTEDMTNAFRTGTAQQNDAAAALAGSFGGGGWIAKQSADAANLAKQVGNMATSARYQDIQDQRGLYESQIGRQMQADQYNTSTQQAAFDAERARMAGAGDFALNAANDDWTSIKNMIGAGDAYQSYTQSLVDAERAAWDEQQNAPYQQLDRALNLLRAASGSGGSSVASSGQPGTSLPATLAGLMGAGWVGSKFFQPTAMA